MHSLVYLWYCMYVNVFPSFENWAPSSEFVSSSIPSWQILTAHAQPFRRAKDLAFCLKVPLDSLLVWASSEGRFWRDFADAQDSQKKDTQGIPPLKRKNGKGVAQSDLEKAEEFNGQFTDVFSKNEHTQVPLLDRSAPFMNDIAVSKDGVIKLLKGLNPSKALGPDELHPRVLKELATELGSVFAHLFQQSIDTGEIPKEWSLANICPLFKKSDRSLACNYRPVSLTCVPCKLLEHIVCSNIMAHLDEYKLLSDRQHAFRKGHSCETQLTTVINDWTKILDNRGQVDTFILDFE